MPKREFAVSGVASIASTIEKLESIIAALKAGTVHVAQGDQHMVVNVSDRVEMTVKASEKKRKQKLSVSLVWHTALPELSETPFSIDSDASAVPPQPLEPADGDDDEDDDD